MKKMCMLALTFIVLFSSSAFAAEKYLARGRWFFVGAGTGTISGYDGKIYIKVQDGIAYVDSTGEAGDESMTHFHENSKWVIKGSDGRVVEEYMNEDFPLSYYNYDNSFEYANEGVRWIGKQTSSTTAELRCVGRVYVQGSWVDLDITYKADKEKMPDPISPEESSGAGCNLGFAPAVLMLLLPLVGLTCRPSIM